jgi:hypothetical protein
MLSYACDCCYVVLQQYNIAVAGGVYCYLNRINPLFTLRIVLYHSWKLCV